MIQTMKNIRQYSVYLLAYTMWASCVAAGFWVVLRLREAMLSLIVIASLDRYEAGVRERFYTTLQMRATDVWSYLLMGMILIVLIVVLETVFRVGAQKGQVWQRFSLVIGVELAVLFLSELSIALAAGAVQSMTWADFIVPIVYLIPAALFGWLWNSIRPKPSAA